MELKGTLETMSVPELLQWLADANKTGTLILTYQSEQKEVYFKDGLIISASSNLDKDRFGVLLVKDGYATQDELLKLLDEGKQEKKLLGKLCVEKGILTQEQTQQMLQQQAEKIIESVFHRQEGDFIFKENLLPDKDLVQISLIMHQLFFDSSTKRNEWRHIQSVLGRLNSVLKPSPNPPEALTKLSEFELSLITLCNGKVTISDICARIHRSDFEICQALTKLVERKWLVHVESPEGPGDEEINNSIWHASILLEQKRFLRAATLLEKLSQQHAGRSDIDSLLKKAAGMLEEDIRKTFASDEICPAPSPDFNEHKLQSLNMTPQDWFVFSRVNGQTTLRDLYRMTGLGKERTLRTMYSLVRSGAVIIRGIKPPGSTTSRIPASGTQARKNDTRSMRAARSTAEIKIPEKFLVDTDQEKMDDRPPIDEKPLDVKELESTYQSFLKHTYYEKLGVSPIASVTKIREAFVSMSRKYHPDMYPQKLQPKVQERLEELFSMINTAYRILSNPASRKRYDEELWADERRQKANLDALNDLLSMSQKSAEKKPAKPAQRPQAPKPAQESPEKPAAPEKQPVPNGDTEQKEGMRMLEQSLFTAEDTKKTKWEQLYEEAKQLAESKKYKPAIESIENAVKYNAKNAELYMALSKLYLKLTPPNIAKAEENIKKALILHPENPQYFCQLSRVFFEKGDLTLAERYSKTALAWDPDQKEAKKILTEIKDKSKGGFFNFLKKKK